MTTSDDGRLGPLDLFGDAQRVYRVLLRHGGASLERLAEPLGVPPGEVAERLKPFVDAGLADIHDGRLVVPRPDRALGDLISAESRRLQKAADRVEAVRQLVPTLTSEYLAASVSPGEAVELEVLTGGNLLAVVQSLGALDDADLLWLRPDPWQVSIRSGLDAWLGEQVASGRRSRAIYPSEVFAEAPELVRARAEVGEQVRVLAHVPARIGVFGTSAAMVPEQWGINSDRRLIVRQPAILAVLRLLFEQLWERAVAVPGLQGADVDSRAGMRRLLLEQLTAGARDDQIARALGLSLRTVRRRVAELLDELGADSRFQAGVQAVRRGWI